MEIGATLHFVPEENLRKRAERDRVPYDLWTRQGFIEATSGNVVDYGAIEQRILSDSALFQVKEIAYAPWNATHIALRLQDEGATMVEFRQGFRSMAAPDPRAREADCLEEARAWQQPGTLMAANVASPRIDRQSQAGQGQLDRADRWHRRPHHGDRPRHGRSG